MSTIIDPLMTWCDHLAEGTRGLTVLTITAPGAKPGAFPPFLVTLCPACALRAMSSLEWLALGTLDEALDPARPRGRLEN